MSSRSSAAASTLPGERGRSSRGGGGGAVLQSTACTPRGHAPHLTRASPRARHGPTNLLVCSKYAYCREEQTKFNDAFPLEK